ncbi:rRNA maturation RNase YbeY [Mangrovibrevibacter kandeliae]|uniref:rRNA maturation RNase YbeY n=1 Tax=Mangrovibrevibacter kandeliae TaxID=2968473 RepID=UPI002119AC7E|nr:rRNA maturation RNase YbeY [Aurantimonas sp. CSK15Z-1]MCQ8782170.1 rRNA maturation RNase YbeY [Aurantimonas sp. CSK15Z-1]
MSTSRYPGLGLSLAVEDPAWERLGLDLERLVRRSLEAAAAGVPYGVDLATEVGITFSNDAAVQALNAEWRGKDKPTNILSFPLVELAPGDRPAPMMGDLILARETVLAEARSEAKAVEHHICHLLVHGFLHLAGFDHQDDAEAERMEALEIAILHRLDIPDPYADGALDGGVASSAA